MLKCLNCVKAKINDSKDHAATSRFCPILIKEQNQLKRRTNCCIEKKLVKHCQSKSSIRVSLLNAHSINTKACHIHVLIVDLKLGILFLTETRQTGNMSPAFTAATPKTHHYFHVTRPGTGSGNLGGGCGAIISRQCKSFL